MDVSENRGTPKWMVKIMKNPLKMDDLEGKPTIFGNIHICVVSRQTMLGSKPSTSGCQLESCEGSAEIILVVNWHFGEKSSKFPEPCH